MQNSLCVQVLRSPILAALLHGTRPVGVSQTLRRDTGSGITELSQRAPPILGWAAITLGIDPHSSYGLPYVIGQAIIFFLFLSFFLVCILCFVDGFQRAHNNSLGPALTELRFLANVNSRSPRASPPLTTPRFNHWYQQALNVVGSGPMDWVKIDAFACSYWPCVSIGVSVCGSLVEWLERWTCDSMVASSIPGPLRPVLVTVFGSANHLRISPSHLGQLSARHSTSGRQPNCGVEQRAPPIFGRAAITLGIGPHF